MEVPLDMRPADRLRVDLREPVLANDLLGEEHVQALEGERHVRVLPYPPVLAVEVAPHELGIYELLDLPELLVLVAVDDVRPRRVGEPGRHEDLFHRVLDLLDVGGTEQGAEPTGEHLLDAGCELGREVRVAAPHLAEGTPDGRRDLLSLEWDNAPIALPYLFDHPKSSSRT